MLVSTNKTENHCNCSGFCSFIIKNYYIYQYKYDLGNARISFKRNSSGALEVTDTNNYYAFGMNHIEGIKSLLGGYLNYKYNGKELQESGMYETAPNFIVLGHELIHVKDHFNGTLNKTEAEHSYSDLKGIRLIETHPKSEFRASGFPGFVDKDGYSENNLRQEQELKLRASYESFRGRTR